MIRKVTATEGKAMADKYNMFFCEVSAHYDIDKIKKIFNMIVKEVAGDHHKELAESWERFHVENAKQEESCCTIF